MRRVLGCAAVAAMAVHFSGTALAGTSSEADRTEEALRQQQIQDLEEQQAEKPKAFWYVEAGPAYFDMDMSSGFGASIDDAVFNFLRQPDSGLDISNIGAKGAIGLIQPIKDSNKRLLGRVDAAWVKHDEAFALPLASGEFLDTLPIDGSLSPGPIGNGIAAPIPASDVTASAEGKFYRVGAFLGFGKEWNKDKRRALIGGGLYGAVGQTHFESRINANNPAYSFTTQQTVTTQQTIDNDGEPITVTTTQVVTTTHLANASQGFIHKDEKVDIWSVGPMLVGEVNFPVSERVDFTLGGRVAALYASGSLNADQIASNLPGKLSVKDDESGFAYMGELKAGFDYKASERVTLSLYGSGEGRNDYYEIRNPRSGPGLNDANPASYAPGPVILDQTLQFIGSLGAAAKFAF